MGAAAGIIANGATEILKRLSSVVANEITLVWDFNDDLKNLQSTLNMILDVMEDAEKKELSQASMRRWMEELKAIAYDAEDILDEYSYEVNLRRHQRNEEYNKSTFFNKVRNVFSSSKTSFVVRQKLAHKVKKINEKFNKIAKRKNDLDLHVDSSSSQHELMNLVTDSLSDLIKFVGRENDKSTIIKMMLEEENSTNKDCGKHVSVIPIVGMGGLGKTNMAQQIYNDEAINRHFDIKVWIWVSDPFDIKKLWKDIATSIGIKSIDMANIRSRTLQNVFKGKKFLLVLDDVWTEKPEDWNNFKKPFMVGRKGSKILVTTRKEKTALIMADKFQLYPLGLLEENDCWSLFKEITSDDSDGYVRAVESLETPNLMEIRKEMVKRCGGLPLAVTFLGRLMRFRNTEKEWKIIRDTKVWHCFGENSVILPKLRLSYDNLPLHLKLCFSYCSLFPKDWIIEREQLIRLWMAEGFLIESPGENTMSMEEIGNEYFHSLLSSFFFQDVEKDVDGNIATCKMHELVHDLARSVVGKNECLIVENTHDIDCISEETRRISLLVNLDDEEMLAKVLDALKKATKLRTIFICHQIIGFDIGNAFKENKRLRVLNLSESITKESTSIGWLKHLRYLVVKGGCFPKGIGRLSFLQTLSEFSVGDKKKKRNASVIQELEGLNLLSGDLTIDALQNVTSEKDARRANLKEKKNLSRLDLSWSYEREAKNAEAVLEGLRPHPNLRTLKINGFGGSKLPRWIEDSSCLPNLVELEIKYSLHLSSITPTTTIFPSLKVLHLSNIDGRAAVETLVTNNLNSLTSLTLRYIPNLITLPRQGLMGNNNTLLSLEITNCHQFESFFPPNNEEEKGHDDDQGGGGGGGGGQQLPQISQVVSSSSSSSSSLQSLTLFGCPAARYYPDFRSLTSLRTLVIQECKESKSLQSLQDELTCLSSSSSSSSLEHLEHVKILKIKTATKEEEVVYEWRKPSSCKE